MTRDFRATKPDRLRLAKKLAETVNAILGTSFAPKDLELTPGEAGFEARSSDGDIIDTRYGTLRWFRLEVCRDFVSLHICFKDTESAKQHLNCNPYSGKWNHYIPLAAFGNMSDALAFAPVEVASLLRQINLQKESD